MPSPIAHSLAGTISWMATGKTLRGSWLVLAVFVANLPDLDFLPGLLVQNANRFHHGITHSLGALVVVVAVVAAVARWRHSPVRPLVTLAALAYGSHLVLDMLAVDTRPPFGIPLFWPLHGAYVLSPLPLFLDVRRAADPSLFWVSLFSRHNFLAVMRESLLLGGALAASLAVHRRKQRRAASSGRSEKLPPPE